MVDPRRRTRWIVAGLIVASCLAALWGLSVGGGLPAGAAGGDRGSGAGGSPPVTWTRTVTVDSGPGRVGPWRMNRSDWRYVDDPAVALDREGRSAVAWVDQSRKAVLFQRYGPGGGPLLEAPADVSRSPEIFSWLPRVAVSPEDADRIYVLWQEIVFSGGTHGGEAFFARSTDGGRSFGEPLNLSETPAGAGKGRLTPELWHNGSLDLAVGPEGTVYAAWTVYEGGLFLARSTDGGSTFSAPLRVTAGGGAEPARGPSLAVAPGGAVHLAWAVGGDPAADLRHAVSRDGGGSFSDPRTLFPGAAHADAPKLAAGGDGALHLAWSESPGGTAGAWEVRYARSPAPPEEGAAAGGEPPDPGATSSSRAFGEPRTISAPAGGDGPGARFPHLALDPDGGPWVLWERYPGGRTDWPRGLSLTSAPDEGRGAFAGGSLVPGTADPAFRVNGSLQGRLARKLALGPAGRVAVVNSGFEPGEASRVRLYLGRTDR